MGLFDFFTRQDKRSIKTAIERKKDTEKLLASLNIPFIEHLPLLEVEHEAKVRKPEDVATRILILTYLNYVSEVPEEKENVIEFLKSHLLWNKVSPGEKEMFQKEELSNQERINISWRSEAIWLLLWAINKVDKIELPTTQVDINEIVLRLPEFLSDPKKFIETATIRSTSDILDIADLIYRLHWATRDASLNKRKVPGNLDNSIVEERHYAINWLTYYAEEWDEVTTDT